MSFPGMHQVSRKVDTTGIRDPLANSFINGLKYLQLYREQLREDAGRIPVDIGSADEATFTTLLGELETALETSIVKTNGIIDLFMSLGDYPLS